MATPTRVIEEEYYSDANSLSARSPETFIVKESGVVVFEDYEQHPKDNGSFVIAEGVTNTQFQQFVADNKGKHFRLRNSKLLFELKQSALHGKVSVEILDQLKAHLGAANINADVDTPLAFNNGDVEVPDVQVSMEERFNVNNPIPNLVCEVAYSNQTVTELHAMCHIYLSPQPHNEDIIAFVAIKASYPIFPQQTFQLLVSLYLKGAAYNVPVQIWSCGTAPVTEAVKARLRELTGLPAHSPVFRGYGFNMAEPPNINNAHAYRLPIPDNVFLLLHANDFLERFVGQAIPQVGFELKLFPIQQAAINGLRRMAFLKQPVAKTLPESASIDHLVDHII